MRQACELIGRGRVIVFDYGATTAELAERNGWLRTYAKHGKGTSPLACPGQQDITSDVAFDQLPPPASLQTQADFLQDWGIQSLVAEGQKEWQQNARHPHNKSPNSPQPPNRSPNPLRPHHLRQLQSRPVDHRMRKSHGTEAA